MRSAVSEQTENKVRAIYSSDTHCLTHSHRKICSIKDKRVDLMPSCVLSEIYVIFIKLILRRFILEP